ncbi:hypothetical protein AB0B15_14360 [Streptomyces sp. NPDC045456]|uniref:hypothetical protein n=1 Tax=Streptomyces sp. NPDC045456 TaxID=3155254 RepID=UPI0033CD65A3
MARIQILELPVVERPDGTEETPFVLVVDQADEEVLAHLAYGVTIGGDGATASTRQHLAEQLGARAILAFEETVEIPANEVPVDPDGYPLKIRVEGDFEQFREQVQQEIAKAQADTMNSLRRGRL